MIEIVDTPRGWPVGRFTDRYGMECSIQDSSLATEATLWLGIDEIKPKIMLPGQGWVDIKLPEGAMMSGRMHLTVEMAKDIRDLLDRFISTGTIRP